MFNGKYFEWNNKKLKGIIDFYGRDFFASKKILDLGCGYADISGPLSRLGAIVTAVDARAEHLKIVNSKYPNIKTVHCDLDKQWLFSDQNFDLILDLSLICHLADYRSHLKHACNCGANLVLETSVCDNNTENFHDNLNENILSYDLSFNGLGSVTNSNSIEKILKDYGMNFKRVDESKFNTNIYKYDWIEKNNNENSSVNRRIWFCNKINNNLLNLNSQKLISIEPQKNSLIGNSLQESINMVLSSGNSLAESKIKFIRSIFNDKFFIKKSILDAGAGTGDIGASFEKLGASVTAADVRQENLQLIKKKYPNIKTIRLNFEAPLNISGKFDIAISIDTICHISNYEKHLRDLCNKSFELILETAVCDSSDPNICFKLSENSHDKMLSASGLANRPSAANIEKILSQSGMYFARIDASELNDKSHKYDWIVTNSNNQDSSLRRFWICSKREYVIKQISEKYIKPIITNNILVASQPNKILNKPIIKESIEDRNLSVIIPAYKSEKFIDTCINSLQKQSDINKLQIIVGIDGCAETLNFFEKNKDRYSDIYLYYFENNVGPYVVKNTLVDKALYENILFFDSDDILIDGAFTKIFNYLKKDTKVDMIRFKYLDFYDNLGIKSAKQPGDFGHGVFFIKKNSFNSLCGFENWKCAADTEFTERIKQNKYKIAHLPDSLFYRRLHKDSLTGSPQTGYKSKLRTEYIKAIENKAKNKKWTLTNKVISFFKEKNSPQNSHLENVENYNELLELISLDMTKLTSNEVLESHDTSEASNQVKVNNITDDINMSNKNINIYHFIPWSTEKNLGAAYNKFMSMLPSDDDWACFLDGDAIHTTTYFGKNIENVIKNNPDYNLFTCVTNRVGSIYQIASGSSWTNDSQKFHRDFGEKLWNTHKSKVLDITNQKFYLSGVLILINKKIWKKAGKFKEEKMLSIDNDIHKKVKSVGGKVGLMQGIYVQHWYRGGNQKNVSHLI